MCAATIAVFVSSNLSTGAGVKLQIQAGEFSYMSDSLFDFTLQNSVHDMWEAGAIALSVLIAVFSGGWPYVKVVAMVVCWMAPIRLLSVRRRETILIWLDALGKWSLIDSYVLVLMLVAFHLQLNLGADMLHVTVYVEPGTHSQRPSISTSPS